MVNQYILSRQIPVPKLLLAFNVCLVSDSVIDIANRFGGLIDDLETPELRSKCLKTQLFFLRVAMYQV